MVLGDEELATAVSARVYGDWLDVVVYRGIWRIEKEIGVDGVRAQGDSSGDAHRGMGV
ncbi:hypothetical protein [Rhodococcus sp. A5(2022)]|uniref:hypothetical protein n=1 Tax=Rhodococcus sp. A5(2022) TaxID=3003588 RepID=UPI0022A8C022|nr:hypothetical protein [Rhodococcus sp. A5(2022)]MCZ1075257.1 hypothetical protein [Rhodococcus sp. A5(2022)]